MKRFMGMMPSDEIEITKRFKVGSEQLTVTIDAGKNGWTILYADHSSAYEDKEDTTENNFNKALILLKDQFTNVNEL